jgi:hypothetical protein
MFIVTIADIFIISNCSTDGGIKVSPFEFLLDKFFNFSDEIGSVFGCSVAGRRKHVGELSVSDFEFVLALFGLA